MIESIGFLLDDTARLFRRHFNTRVRDQGITALQWRVLAHLHKQPGARQSGLAEMIEVEPITLSRMIDRLADHGLVERRSDHGDRRAWNLFLTPRATRLVGEGRASAATLVDEVMGDMSVAEVEQLAGLIDRVRYNLSRRTPSGTR